MRYNRRTWKRSTALLMTLAMVLSLPTGITTPRQAQAADYGLNNPTTDSNGVTTWDCVYFGNYWQNDTNGDGVADENDEKQPIKWRVLSVDGDDAFLLADQNLDAGIYDESYTNVTWEDCTMRSWLNGYGASSNVDGIDYSSDNFIDAAFTSAERNAIKQVTVVNEDNPYNGTEGGNDTNDKVYLLSIAEASNASYGFNSTFDEYSDTRMAASTAYVAEKRYENYIYMYNAWWLRSPSAWDIRNYASIVNDDGYGYCYLDNVSYAFVAVRPVLHLNLSSSNLWSYADTASAMDESRSVATPIPTGSASEKPASIQKYGLSNPTTDSNRVTTWDCVYFGNYWQNDTNGDGVADKNDEKQSIKWRVLSVDGDDAFLLADQNLDAEIYNKSETDVTWETCTMRSWLNGYGTSSNVDSIDYSSDNFIDAAFTSAEQNAIRQVAVANEDNLYYGTGGGNDTNDKVYLLSIAEVSNASYGFYRKFKMSSDTRVATNTAYVAEKYLVDAGEAEEWWLRSPGRSGGRVSCVFDDGGVYYDGFNVCSGYIVVRPALHLNLSTSDLWSYAGTVSSNGTSNPVVTPTPTPEPDITPSAQPTASPRMTPAPSTTPSNTKATLSSAAVGTTIKDKTASYKVISADKKQPAVAYTKVLKKNASSVTVPDKIKVNGVTYQVKSIAPKAFANNKKLKKITIGKNVASIGKQAFSGCKKLKKITIKSAKLKSSSIGKNAFKGTAKKLTFKVPKKKYKAYKKFLKKKGNKTVKVTK